MIGPAAKGVIWGNRIPGTAEAARIFPLISSETLDVGKTRLLAAHSFRVATSTGPYRSPVGAITKYRMFELASYQSPIETRKPPVAQTSQSPKDMNDF